MICFLILRPLRSGLKNWKKSPRGILPSSIFKPKGFLNKATPLAPLQQSNLYAGLRNADVDNAMRTLFNKQVHQDDNVTKFIRGQGVDLTIPIQGPTIRGA